MWHDIIVVVIIVSCIVSINCICCSTWVESCLFILWFEVLITIHSQLSDPKTTLTKHEDVWLTTPGERTNIRGLLVVESSTTELISNTGGSTNLHKVNIIIRILIWGDIKRIPRRFIHAIDVDFHKNANLSHWWSKWLTRSTHCMLIVNCKVLNEPLQSRQAKIPVM